MAVKTSLPVGVENFGEIRTMGLYYVDKTLFIKTLLENWGKVKLFTRPRRFGKTLNISMLKSDVTGLFLMGLKFQRKKNCVRSIWGNTPSFLSV